MTAKSTRIPLCPNCTLCLWPLSLSLSPIGETLLPPSLSCPSSLFSFFFLSYFLRAKRNIVKRYDSRQKKCTGAYRSVHTISYRKNWLVRCRSVIWFLRLNSAGDHLENINLFFYILFHIILLMRLSRSIN